ncbi:hypothetical protein Tco_0682018 [Tanacetum coccineum]|uniref:Xylulose kinase-1 n=1 Tax=Tanacetum coccineum TaxID=301880 RepID=A0ABQ4XQ80_9ASTR
MANLEFYDKHNMVAYLKKPTGSEGFQKIVDFLNRSHIRFVLTKNPTIYVSLIKKFWHTATVRTIDNGEQEITATVDGKEFTVTKASVRRHLQLADVEGEVVCGDHDAQPLGLEIETRTSSTSFMLFFRVHPLKLDGTEWLEGPLHLQSLGVLGVIVPCLAVLEFVTKSISSVSPLLH